MNPVPTIEYIAGNEQQIAQMNVLMFVTLVILVIACAFVAKRWAEAAGRLKLLEGEVEEQERRRLQTL